MALIRGFRVIAQILGNCNIILEFQDI